MRMGITMSQPKAKAATPDNGLQESQKQIIEEIMQRAS